MNPKAFPQFAKILLPIEPIEIVAFEHDFLHIFFFVVTVAVLTVVAEVVVVVVHPHPPPRDPLASAANNRLLEVAILAGRKDHVVAVGDLLLFPHRRVEFEVVAAGTLRSHTESAVDRAESDLGQRHGGDDGGAWICLLGV